MNASSSGEKSSEKFLHEGETKDKKAKKKKQKKRQWEEKSSTRTLGNLSPARLVVDWILKLNFFPSFHNSKTQLKLAISRLNLKKSKKQNLNMNLKREVAELLRTGKEESARIKVSKNLLFFFFFGEQTLCEKKKKK
jgi:hypothetical protein